MLRLTAATAHRWLFVKLILALKLTSFYAEFLL
jgi:hypothetical protein